jgi:RNA polymerase sigma factor (sigma-70 family)
VLRYQDLAFRVAYLIVGSTQDAEDSVQDAFLRAYNALGRFRAGAPLRPWLLTIVANAARTRRTAAVRHPTLELSAAANQSADSAISPEVVAVATSEHRELLRAVNALRDDDRQMIAYRYFLDLSEAEMAAALGCPRGTVKSRLARARQRLRRRLAEAADGGTDHG